MYNIQIQLKHSYELYKHLGMDLVNIIKENKKADAIKKALKEDKWSGGQF